MRNTNNHSEQCCKQSFGKCEGVCRTYSALQSAYAQKLQDNDSIVSFKCNIPLEGIDIFGGSYTTDFYAVKTNDDIMIRECIEIDDLMKLKNAKLMDQSRCYWLKRGITDWGIVTSAEE